MVTMCTTCCNIKQLQFDRAVCVLNHSNNVHCMVPVLHTHTHTHTHTHRLVLAVQNGTLHTILGYVEMNCSWQG